MKKELLIATLRDPPNPPAKGIDERRFVGPESFIADLPDEQIDTFDTVVTLLTEKYDQRQENQLMNTLRNMRILAIESQLLN